MTASTLPPEAKAAPPDGGDMVTDLDIVGGLGAYLNLLEGEHTPFIKYFRGSLTLVSPSLLHERVSEGLDGVVKAIGCELDINYYPTGTTLYRRKGFDSGIMADQTYYIQHVEALADLDREAKEIDLDRYPPPDLAIEVVVTNPAAKSLKICAELGIPEVWVYDAGPRALTFWHLGGDGRYTPHSASLAFSFLNLDDVAPWIEAGWKEPFNLWSRRLRAWVREVLGPRRT